MERREVRVAFLDGEGSQGKAKCDVVNGVWRSCTGNCGGGY